MRQKKAKALRRIAKRQASIIDGVTTENQYSMTEVAKIPHFMNKLGEEPEVFIISKALGPTKLVNCERAIYQKLKSLL